MLDTSRMPSYAFLSPQAIERREEDTLKGAYSLLPFEKTWRDRQPGLLQRGYLLRQRYHPDWKPSWEGTNVDPDFCEDSVAQLVSLVNHNQFRRRFSVYHFNSAWTSWTLPARMVLLLP